MKIHLFNDARAAAKSLEDLYGGTEINPAILEDPMTFDEFMSERELDNIYDRLPSCGETITYERRREI